MFRLALSIWAAFLTYACILFPFFGRETESTPNIPGYNLPVFPISTNRVDGQRRIPRVVYRAIENSSNISPNVFDNLKRFSELNNQWEQKVFDNKAQNEFMANEFFGTSLLWAYEAIHPELGAARADIWRYAVLWLNGGVYIDDDATFTAPLQEFIRDEDSFLLSEELGEFTGCFHIRSRFAVLPAFEGRKQNLIQWAIVSERGHPFLSRTLRNIVELVRGESFHVSEVNGNFGGEKIRWKRIVCTTGPGVYTASIREVFSEQIPGLRYRWLSPGFREIGGVAKVFERSGAYKALMSDQGMSLLKEYQSKEMILRAMQNAWLASSSSELTRKFRSGIANLETLTASIVDFKSMLREMENLISHQSCLQKLLTGITLVIENPIPGAVVVTELAVKVSVYIHDPQTRSFLSSVTNLDLLICFTVDRDHYTRDCSLKVDKKKLANGSELSYDMLAQGYTIGTHSFEASLVVETEKIRDELTLYFDASCEGKLVDRKGLPIVSDLGYLEDEFTSLISVESYFEVKQNLETVLEIIVPAPNEIITKLPVEIKVGFYISPEILEFQVLKLVLCMNVNQKLSMKEEENICNVIYDKTKVGSSALLTSTVIYIDGISSGRHLVFADLRAYMLNYTNMSTCSDIKLDNHCNQLLLENGKIGAISYTILAKALTTFYYEPPGDDSSLQIVSDF